MANGDKPKVQRGPKSIAEQMVDFFTKKPKPRKQRPARTGRVNQDKQLKELERQGL